MGLITHRGLKYVVSNIKTEMEKGSYGISHRHDATPFAGQRLPAIQGGRRSRVGKRKEEAAEYAKYDPFSGSAAEKAMNAAREGEAARIQ